ncbi:uncharacterized protein K460DRAFT_406650 [Cucurbitaria berberidis CBS 394.84]|uniref:Uncharacterized protein n=1 Tax=Cucurbitaria berberidis CBS 394.84 TaxID=1168544 RepID=A0A9P4GJJ6_9PLEO|nr:uncharacterized protein K460DRAFT_406650 [Cucurbitaria berberidis CBS 394.84]KAF1846447.1 hypothetical protein K460DRAFT_406650 [Cucurbitaria berberidis CBS 394.84]
MSNDNGLVFSTLTAVEPVPIHDVDHFRDEMLRASNIFGSQNLKNPANSTLRRAFRSAFTKLNRVTFPNPGYNLTPQAAGIGRANFINEMRPLLDQNNRLADGNRYRFPDMSGFIEFGDDGHPTVDVPLLPYPSQTTVSSIDPFASRHSFAVYNPKDESQHDPNVQQLSNTPFRPPFQASAGPVMPPQPVSSSTIIPPTRATRVRIGRQSPSSSAPIRTRVLRSSGSMGPPPPRRTPDTAIPAGLQRVGVFVLMNTNIAKLSRNECLNMMRNFLSRFQNDDPVDRTNPRYQEVVHEWNRCIQDTHMSTSDKDARSNFTHIRIIYNQHYAELYGCSIAASASLSTAVTHTVSMHGTNDPLTEPHPSEHNKRVK